MRIGLILAESFSASGLEVAFHAPTSVCADVLVHAEADSFIFLGWRISALL